MSNEALNEDPPDVERWKKEARFLQQIIFIRLGDREWDELDISDNQKSILIRKVEFGLFFLTGECVKEDYSTDNEAAKHKKIECVTEVILENANSNRIHFATIFVFGKIGDKRFTIPVFKVKVKENHTLFVDSNSKVYEDWQNYLDSNNLPRCMYCYPQGGTYQEENGQVLVNFGKSPACFKKIKFSFDNPPLEVAFTSIPQIVISLIIDLIAPSLSDGQEPNAGRLRNNQYRVLHDSIGTLVNLFLDDQSIGLDDANARMAWISIWSCIIGFVRESMCENFNRLTEAGEIANNFIRNLFDFSTICSINVNFLGIINCLFSMCNANNQTPPLYFEAASLFFSNLLLSVETADNVIENLQQEVLKEHRDNLTERQLEVHCKLAEQVQGDTLLEKNANKIKAIRHIRDKNEFYECIVKSEDYLASHQVQFSSKEPGLININNELHIAPNKFVEISEEDKELILDATTKVKYSKIDNNSYRECIERILKKNRLTMEYQRHQTIFKLNEAFKTNNFLEATVGEVKIFRNITPSELDRLANVMKTTAKNYDSRILKIVNEFAKRCCCKNSRDYCSYLEFAVEYLETLKREKESKFTEALQGVPSTELYKFRTNYGIKGKRSQHFRNQVFDSFEHEEMEESYKKLMEFYVNREENAKKSNENICPKFKSIVSATYHYFKHSKFGSKILTEEEYFTIASQLVNDPVNRRSTTLNQQGDRKIMTFKNPINGAVGIVYETLADGDQSIATCFYDSKIFEMAEKC